MSNVGFARQTNTDSKVFNAGFNAHALSNCYGSMLSTAHAISNSNCWMLSTAHAISNCKCSMLSTAYAPSNCSYSQHMPFQTVKNPLLLTVHAFLTGNICCSIYDEEKCPMLRLYAKPTLTLKVFNAGINALRTLQCNSWVQSHSTVHL